MCPSPGHGSGTSRGAGTKFPEIGTPGTAGALSSGLRPLGEVEASAPPSPRAPALPSRGPEHAPSLALGSLFLGFSLFSRPWEPLFRASSFIQTQLLVREPRTPAPQLGLGGALRPIRHGPAPPPSSLSPLSRPPGLQEALALPFSDPPPSKLGLDSASPRAPSRLPFTAAKL